MSVTDPMMLTPGPNDTEKQSTRCPSGRSLERTTMPSLFVYTLTFDTGFAPHVDEEGRFLTLATCKPDLRRPWLA